MIVVGLGNPGDRYRDTRHNIGFRVVDELESHWGGSGFKSKFSGQIALAEFRASGGVRKVYLLKPQTYMNLSGDSVQPAAAFFKVPPQDILVLHDELDLPFGRLQLKEGGGTGGHNGLKSVSARLGTPNFKRLRLGIGRPPPDFRGSPADYVLKPFAPHEAEALTGYLDRAVDAVELLLEKGMAAAMNQVNRRLD